MAMAIVTSASPKAMCCKRAQVSSLRYVKPLRRSGVGFEAHRVTSSA